jgi:hypothetical protein
VVSFSAVLWPTNRAFASLDETDAKTLRVDLEHCGPPLIAAGMNSPWSTRYLEVIAVSLSSIFSGIFAR